MSFALINCRACVGIDAPPVFVEVHLAGGLPAFYLVGVPEAVVRESKDRVRAAIITSGFEFPARRITVNLAPANLPKEGGRFDLAIALGILIASHQVKPIDLSDYEFYGELSLSGNLRSFRGGLAIAAAASQRDRVLIMPKKTAEMASRVNGVEIREAGTLMDVAGFVQGQNQLAPLQKNNLSINSDHQHTRGDFSDVRGQVQACRALEIAASGGHHVLMMGPPGSGKSMLAGRLPTILPPLTHDESLQSATLFDVAGIKRNPQHWQMPVMRTPHHTATAVGLVGGGRLPLPGEISLAHCGVLFLDELAEFSRNTLEVLRQPLEDGQVSIVRAAGRFTYPSKFQLIAAMNPCPCGYAYDSQKECVCGPDQMARYLNKVSGPLMDRIDLHLNVPRPSASVLAGEGPPAESSSVIRKRVVAARQRQLQRGRLNCDLTVEQLNVSGLIEEGAKALLREFAERKAMSARSWSRALKVARTIADLDSSEKIKENHMGEALTLRVFGVG